MRRALLWGALLLAASAAAEPPLRSAGTGPAELEGRVVAIADGDTLTLLVGREQVRIRLAQIDAPESGQPYGRASKAALSALAFGKPARVVIVDTDRYGRTVGEVFVDGVHVNQAMVREGHAWAYTEYSRSLEIIELEDAARAARKGIWQLPEAQRDAPWIWRREHRGATPSKSDPALLVCGKRPTCKQMTTCEEARFQLTTCGLTSLDGDRDGVPCESLCGRAGKTDLQ